MSRPSSWLGAFAFASLLLSSVADAQSPRDATVELQHHGRILHAAPDCTSVVPRATASVAVNHGVLDVDTRVYLSAAHPASQTGTLASYSLDPRSGAVLRMEWEASRRLAAADRRQIITTSSASEPVAFRWESLDQARRTQLANDPSLLHHLRGGDAGEGSRFRVRRDDNGPNKLGAMSSQPVFVGAPSFRYKDEMETVPYSRFADDLQDRTAMLYVGAMDGKLHGFDAASGDESFAYVPGAVFSRLHHAATGSLLDQPHVAGSPAIGDAFFGGAWRTVLIGGLGRGGQGVYALDITDPRRFASAESDPAAIALWEFTDAQDPDLGFTHSRPVVVRLRDGRWAAIFGNGYGSDADDGASSKTGNAVLYVVDIASGGLIRKLDTNVGRAEAPADAAWANGLSTPSATDMNGDRIVDVVYAGDLYGNLWKFDFTALRSEEWTVAFGGAPLYRARSATGRTQPIVTRPEAARGPQGVGAMVLFGAGHTPEPTGFSTSHAIPSSVYGVVDRNQGGVHGRTNLLEQRITHELNRETDDQGQQSVRVSASRTQDHLSGWYIDLAVKDGAAPSESLASHPLIRDGKIMFASFAPDSDPCSTVGDRWMMRLDVLTGAAQSGGETTFGVVHHNSANSIAADPTTQETATLPVSGVSMPGTATVDLQSLAHVQGAAGECVDHIYSAGPAGEILHLATPCPATRTGRQSWRQLR